MESQTWDYARHDTFSGFADELREDQSTESQMPLGMFAFWSWCRVWGTGEFAMRSVNFVWAAIVLFAFARIGRQLSLPWLPLLFAVQPFVWYYMNYARTPLMQMAGGSLILAGALGYIRKNAVPDGIGGIFLCLGAILLSGANIYGLVPLAAVAIGLTVHGVWRRIKLPLTGKIVATLTLGAIALLGAYYVLVFFRGGKHVGASLWVASPANLAFVIYEFLGFLGLGPGRQDLRAVIKGAATIDSIIIFLPGLFLLAAGYVVAFSASIKSWLTREASLPGGHFPPESRPTWAMGLIAPWLMGLGVPLLSSLLLFLIATLGGLFFWGHHLAGAFPFWVLALGITLHWGTQGLWRPAGRYAFLGIFLLLLASSLLIRFAPWHHHDDYRSAAKVAQVAAASGKNIWWFADHSGGNFYGISFAEGFNNRPGEIEFSMNRSAHGNPDIIILSRPDVFDSGRTTRKILSAQQYFRSNVFQAFEIWEKKPMLEKPER